MYLLGSHSIGNAFNRKHSYWHWQYIYYEALVLLLATHFPNIANSPGGKRDKYRETLRNIEGDRDRDRECKRQRQRQSLCERATDTLRYTERQGQTAAIEPSAPVRCGRTPCHPSLIVSRPTNVSQLVSVAHRAASAAAAAKGYLLQYVHASRRLCVPT